MYSSMLRGRNGDDESQRTNGGVTLVPIGRIEGKLQEEFDEEIRADEVIVVHRENDITVAITGTAKHD